MVKSLACVTLFVGIVAGCSSDPDTLSGNPRPARGRRQRDNADAKRDLGSASCRERRRCRRGCSRRTAQRRARSLRERDQQVTRDQGPPPLKRWTEAEVCTDGQCKSDSETGRARRRGAFGRCGENAQNECPGWNGKPETMIEGCLKMMWDEKFGSGEKGHYENMKNTRFTRVSCGFFVTPNGKTWAIQNFRP